jgi:hypothetical protein
LGKRKREMTSEESERSSKEENVSLIEDVIRRIKM